MSACPLGVGHHGLAAEFMEGDVLRGMPRRGRDRHGREHPLLVARGPLQHLHAAHRTSDDCEQLLDAEMVDEAHLSFTMSPMVMTGKSRPSACPSSG